MSLAVGEGLSGLIATNTTIRRDLLTTDPNETGGLSGRPLHTFAADRIERVLACVDGRVPVIGVGGIERAEQVRRLMHLGCAAVQIYTSFIYEGLDCLRGSTDSWPNDSQGSPRPVYMERPAARCVDRHRLRTPHPEPPATGAYDGGQHGGRGPLVRL